MQKFFSKLGQAFMLPIALLPAAGIMLGLGGSFTNPEMIEAYNLTGILGGGTVLNGVLNVMKSAGDIVFANLPLMFAIALAIGFAKTDKGTAALAAVMAFLIMNVAISQTLIFSGVAEIDMVDGVRVFSGNIEVFGKTFSGMLTTTLGIANTLQMGVFGGMIAGGATAYLHNKYHDIKLPEFLGFFGGARFVPIVASFAALVYGALLVVIWPFIGGALAAVGNSLGLLSDAGFGWTASLLFGLIERSLIPFGLHHVFYLPLWQTNVGATAVDLCGQAEVFGTQNIFFASLSCGDFSQFPATNFMTGKFPFMMFGLPAAAFAMYSVADGEHKKETGGLLFSVAFTAFLTGITEPIEFTFLFLAPFLYYGIHVPIAGISFALMDALQVKVGMTFSGGFIDFLLFGVLPGTTGAENNWYYIPLVGIILAPIYYFTFRWYILKKDIATPGRNGSAVRTVSKSEYRDSKESVNGEFINKIIDGLGGKENIIDVEACITRLRVSVVDASLVKDNDFWTQQMQASGIMKNGTAMQVIYGAKAQGYKNEISKVLGL